MTVQDPVVEDKLQETGLDKTLVKSKKNELLIQDQMTQLECY